MVAKKSQMMFSPSPITFKKISEREIVLHVEKKWRSLEARIILISHRELKTALPKTFLFSWIISKRNVYVQVTRTRQDFP